MTTLDQPTEQARSATAVRLRNFAGVLVAFPIALLVLWTLGGLFEQAGLGLPIVPTITLWGLPIDLIIRDLAAALTVGFALVGGVLAPRPDPFLGRLASLSAVVWLAAILAQSVLTISEILARPLGDSFDITIMQSLLLQTTLGQTMLIQLVIVTCVALLAWVVLGRATGIVVFIAAAVAASLPGFTGHSGISDGHNSATISLGLHIVAASVWLGGLVATVVYIARRSSDRGKVLRRFSVVALVSVIVIVETGLLNVTLRIDGIAPLLTSQYGAIILAKSAVLIILIGYGWRQRKNIAARLELSTTNDASTATLMRFAGWELLWMGAAFGLSVALSRTAPPGFVTVGDRPSASALLLVAAILPMALYLTFSSRLLPKRVESFAYPEALVVMILIVVILTSMLFPAIGESWLLQALSIAAMLALIVLGYLFTTVAVESRARVAIATAMAGWPVVTWWVERDVVGGLGLGTWLTVLLAEGVFVWLLFQVRDSKQQSSTSDRMVAP